jgi:PST family polysaccharide transporter
VEFGEPRRCLALEGAFMSSLKQSVVRGGIAKTAAQIANFVVRIGALMALARILEPSEFGLVAMVGAVTGVFNLLRDAGLSMATIQSAEITDEQLSTLFWINVLLGVLLTLASAAIAPALAAFYREPRLVWVTVALGTGFLVNGLGVQHSALLQRHMRFGTVALVETTSLLLSTAVGIGMALGGQGYWALVGMAMVAPLVSTVGFWIAAAWVPGRPGRRVGVGSMIRFGGTITLNSLLMYVAYNLDKVLLGRFWGADVLGVYGRAYQLVNIPTDNFNAAVGGVAFSALSRLQGDPERFRSYFLKGYALVLAMTIPVTAACGALAEDIVLVALGPKWGSVAPLLRLLAPTILVFSIINPLSWLMMSNNLAGRSLRIALVIAPLVVISYLAGLPHGATGVAFAFSAVMLLLAVPVSIWCVYGTVVSPRDLLEVAGRPLLAGAVAVGGALLARPVLSGVRVPLLRLTLEAAWMIGVYAGVLLYALGQKAVYVDLFRRLTRRSEAGA